jgi:phosphoglycolate phosphatase
MFEHIFFDLDGTLTKSEFGIVDSVEYALEKFGIKENDRESLKRFIGPPLYNSFRTYYGFDDEQAEEAVRLYREFYISEGLYRTPLYDGIKECLEALCRDRCLYVVTAKPQETAGIIVDNLKIRPYLKAVVGPDPVKKDYDKSGLIRRALTEHNIEDKSRVVMVGDREYDILGAKECEVSSVGVLYGYGTEEELTKAGADMLAGSVEELKELLMNH